MDADLTLVKFTLGGKDSTKEGSLPENVVPAKRSGTEEVRHIRSSKLLEIADKFTAVTRTWQE